VTDDKIEVDLKDIDNWPEEAWEELRRVANQPSPPNPPRRNTETSKGNGFPWLLVGIIIAVIVGILAIFASLLFSQEAPRRRKRRRKRKLGPDEWSDFRDDYGDRW
jgi:hypothetical protein